MANTTDTRVCHHEYVVVALKPNFTTWVGDAIKVYRCAQCGDEYEVMYFGLDDNWKLWDQFIGEA